MSEVAFFVGGVLPYWYTLCLREKTTGYWCVLLWCCCVWAFYFGSRGQWAPLVNNIVEMGIASVGLARLRREAV
jgi:hypothetical protein